MHVLLGISVPQLESTNDRDRTTKLSFSADVQRGFIKQGCNSGLFSPFNLCILFYFVLILV